ncbi:MAG: glycosyltransferase [bacterium]|nr:glycosyltransferase [bacterium]
MTSGLSIVRVMPFFHLRRGGSVAQAELTCAELGRRGHRVRVVTSDLDQARDIPRDEWFARDGYEVYHASVGKLGRMVPYRQPELHRPLSEACETANLLCTNVGLSWTGALTRRCARAAGLPYVFNAEGALCPVRLRDKRLRKAAFLTLYERRTIREATAIHALTQKDEADAIRQGAVPERVHVIPNGVELPSSPPDRDAARARLGWDGDDFVVLFLGRLTAMKGPDRLLAAALPLLRANRARLVLAGPDDGMANTLTRRAAEHGVLDRVALPGLVTGRERADLWSAADAFALPSASEGLPLGPLEAAAHGAPLLVSPACHLPEVAEFDAGAIVEPDVDTLRAALTELADKPELRQRRSANARRMIAEHFALARVVDRLEALYREVCGI